MKPMAHRTKPVKLPEVPDVDVSALTILEPMASATPKTKDNANRFIT